jgi:Rrf2 family transcriptional regulator, iron-sulfur cluster assembly transcription factor
MLSITTEHALRALCLLACTPDGGSLLGRELSERADIPATYLSKIMLTLRNGGYVAATRGLGGGYRLLRSPETVTLLDIVELFEGPRTHPRCVLGYGTCSDEAPCGAHNTWCKVREHEVAFLHKTRLSDVCKTPMPKKKGKRVVATR